MTAPLPTCDEPPLVYRVLEELHDGGPNRVRYESRDGVQTGTRVGMYVVRDAMDQARGGEFFCGHCDRAIPEHEAVVVDVLDVPAPLSWAVSRDIALTIADECSRHGAVETRAWRCEVLHRSFRGEPIRSYREWRESREAERGGDGHG